MQHKEGMLVKHAFLAIHKALLLFGKPVVGDFFAPLKIVSEFVAKKVKAADRDAIQLKLALNKLEHWLDECARRIEYLASDYEKKNDPLIIFLSKQLQPTFFALADNLQNNKISTASATKSLEEFIYHLKIVITIDTNVLLRKSNALQTKSNALQTENNALARKKQETRRVRATKETLLTDDPTTEDTDTFQAISREFRMDWMNIKAYMDHFDFPASAPPLRGLKTLM